MSVSVEQRAALRLEMFRTTGMSIDEDDPIILCALMQAKLMRDAATDASLYLEQSLTASLQKVERTIEAKSDELALKIARQISSSVQEKAEIDAKRLSDQLACVAKSLHAKMRVAGDSDPEQPHWGKRVIVILVITIAGSALIAAKYVNVLSASEREHLKFGQQVARALPSMDAKARKALFDAIRATPE